MAEKSVGELNIPSYLKDALVGASKNIDATMTDVASIMQQAGTNTAGETSAMMDEARAKAEAETLLTARKVGIEASNKEQIAKFGTNPEASSYVLSAMAGNILSIKGELDQRDKALQEKLDTKFSDDPIGWITNQFTIPGDVLAFTHRAEALNRNNSVMQMLLARSSEAVSLNKAIDAGTDMQVAAALEKQVLAGAQQRVAEANNKLVQMNLTGINIRQAANMNQANLMIAAQSAEATQQRLQLERQAGWRAEKTLQLQQEMKQFALDEKQEKLETRAVIQEKLNRVASITGSEPLTVLQYLHMGAKRRDMYDTLMTDPDFDEQRLGYNTAVAVEKANQLGFPLNPGMNYVRGKLNNIASAAPAQIKPGETQWDKLKPAEQLSKVQAAYETSAKTELNNIPYEGSIYSPPPLSAVLKIPLVSNLSIAKDLAIFARDEVTPTNADQVFSVAVEKVIKGEATPAQMAKEVSTFYSLMAADNNTQRGYKQLVLPMLTPQTGYKTSVHLGGSIWGKPEVVNTMSPVQVENAIYRKAVGQGLGKNNIAADTSTGQP